MKRTTLKHLFAFLRTCTLLCGENRMLYLSKLMTKVGRIVEGIIIVLAGGNRVGRRTYGVRADTKSIIAAGQVR